MLERLDEVQWGELAAGYCPADWVPQTIRDLLDANADARCCALTRLEEGVFYQATAVEATPQVVPFLMELAAEKTVPGRPDLLMFLARLVGRYAPDPLTSHEGSLRELRASSETQLRREEAMAQDVPPGVIHAPVRACRVNTFRNMLKLERLLADDDPDVRIATGYVLAYLLTGAMPIEPPDPPELATRVIGRVWEAIPRESDDRVQASHVIALGALATVYRDARERLHLVDCESGRSGAFSPMAEAWACLRRITLGEPFDAETIRRFATQILRLELAAYQDLPWWGGLYEAEESISLRVVEHAVFGQAARALDRHPGAWVVIEEVVGRGLPPERANAIRLLNQRSVEPTQAGMAVDLEPSADYRVGLAFFEGMFEQGVSPTTRKLRRVVVDAFRDGDLGDRLRAAELLGQSTSLAAAVAEVVRGDRDPRVSATVAEAIRGERDPRVQAALSQSFDELEDVRTVGRSIATWIAWLNQPIEPGELRYRRAIWDRLKSWAPRCAPKKLAPFLLDRIHDSARIRDRDPERAQAVEIYGALSLSDAERRGFMTELMRHDPDPKVRRAAIDPGLSPRVPAARLPLLEDLLVALSADPDEQLRACIAGRTLKSFLLDSDVDTDVAEAIVAALARTQDDDPSWLVRCEAVRLLGVPVGQGWLESVREPAIAALVRAIGRDPAFRVRAQAAIALQDVGDAVPGLLALLSTASPEGRASAADALSNVGRPGAIGAVPELFTALEHEPHGEVRAWIARTLCFLVDGDEVGGWIERLSRALRDSEPTVRTWIVNLLVRAGPMAAFATTALTDCLDSDNYALRQSALRALKGLAQVSGTDVRNTKPSAGDPGGGAG